MPTITKVERVERPQPQVIFESGEVWALLAARLQGGLRHTAFGTAFLKETGK